MLSSFIFAYAGQFIHVGQSEAALNILMSCQFVYRIQFDKFINQILIFRLLAKL